MLPVLVHQHPVVETSGTDMGIHLSTGRIRTAKSNPDSAQISK